MFDIISTVDGFGDIEAFDDLHKAIYMGGYLSGAEVLMGNQVDAYRDGYNTAEAVMSGQIPQIRYE